MSSYSSWFELSIVNAERRWRCSRHREVRLRKSEVGFRRAAFRASPVLRNVLPARSRSEARGWVAERFVVHVAAYVANELAVVHRSTSLHHRQNRVARTARRAHGRSRALL